MGQILDCQSLRRGVLSPQDVARVASERSRRNATGEPWALMEQKRHIFVLRCNRKVLPVMASQVHVCRRGTGPWVDFVGKLHCTVPLIRDFECSLDTQHKRRSSFTELPKDGPDRPRPPRP
ncbi:uncharacterized protein PGTG_06562 [Puccinia graminis f. sp. tritici CRL 75-36-700-3]|uniref:Uncharacterized protein n=1 Tax=Puccinia graminis f. sp. tritici (strain CRL 75-36-700-3 / race SCCL) TaxID=418459 RepID=E3K8J7_PUCGT|nr:uncharacterized protein PGTG_06562 [Puccinia graminis f. sp. tritici CRL 75-36-700-3]EFP80606.1 hypothetical protein PGTG_06562 [Puccinia graminis f. sp. tritici CRL 75-36-700-3]